MVPQRDAPVGAMERTMTPNLTVANTILSQLGGAGRLSAMISAKNFVADASSLRFQFSGSVRIGNIVTVSLTEDDTYTVTFSFMRGLNFRDIKVCADVYAANLRHVIEAHTGLLLSL